VSIGHGYSGATGTVSVSSSVDPLVTPITCSTTVRPGPTTDSCPRRSSRSPSFYSSPSNPYTQDIPTNYPDSGRNPRNLSQFNPNAYYNQYFSQYMRSNEFNSLQSILPHLDSPLAYSDHSLSNLGHPYDYPYASYAHYTSQPVGLPLVHEPYPNHPYTHQSMNSGPTHHSGYFPPAKLTRGASNMQTVSTNSLSPNSVSSNPPYLDYHGSSVPSRPSSRSRMGKITSLNGQTRRERMLNGDGEHERSTARSTERGNAEETGE
ncbi:unnamed protein product, partial [Echinostoma caproni]|uniref:Eyes absent homolog n=1 Tax=Echinostoma caproni TaxID=27848 RepID=A0A183B587_9TREM